MNIHANGATIISELQSNKVMLHKNIWSGRGLSPDITVCVKPNAEKGNFTKGNIQTPPNYPEPWGPRGVSGTSYPTPSRHLCGTTHFSSIDAGSPIHTPEWPLSQALPQQFPNNGAPVRKPSPL